MLTKEHLDTAAVYGNDSRPALHKLGWYGKLLDKQHSLDCCKEIETILTETTIIDGIAVKTDWMKNVDEMVELIHLAASCAQFGV